MVRPPRPSAPRREAVVAGHSGDLDTARRLLHDEDPAVRCAALGALDRLGALGGDTLAGALADPDPAVRRRACALAGRGLAAGDARLGPDALLGVLSSDPDASVVECAAWALGEAGSRCGGSEIEALELVVRTQRDPLCREAAVAALGAVAGAGAMGGSGALDTVLFALGDKPAIRRRATIALAAFDDPRVEVALRSCLEDRDWQVRQAAEDLLGRT